jgi:hypothetical protein
LPTACHGCAFSCSPSSSALSMESSSEHVM